jgi:hypothetical protein
MARMGMKMEGLGIAILQTRASMKIDGCATPVESARRNSDEKTLPIVSERIP